MSLFVSIILAIFCATAWWLILNRKEKKLLFVLNSLRDEDSIEDQVAEKKQNDTKIKNSYSFISDEFGQAGLFESAERKRFQNRQVLATFLTPFVVLLLSYIAGLSPLTIFLLALLGLSSGYLISRRMLFKRKDEFKRSLVFYLPIVMERLVMAVEAGLDVMPALKAIIELENRDHKDSGFLEDIDPVSKLLAIVHRITDAGISFEKALHEVADQVKSSALRHAFIHLAVAHREGGELIMPLRELSESTQLYYQESVEEEIAKMPVKATMPLVVTFTGLIILFISSPIIQVMQFSAQSMPK